jgi:hypothetical protein
LLHIPYKGRGQLPDPAILCEILAENEASKIYPQEENKKRRACSLNFLEKSRYRMRSLKLDSRWQNIYTVQV